VPLDWHIVSKTPIEELSMFERRSDPLLPRREFFSRLMRCAVTGAGIIA